jgi:Tol biopolymer transport system component
MDLRVVAALLAVVFLAAAEGSDRLAVVAPSGPYLQQVPPGLKPVLFAEGIVSTDVNDVGCSFTPDGRELYFGRFEPGRGYTILVMKDTPSGWTEPRIAPYSSNYSEIDPFITGDGRRCFFISKRPPETGAARSSVYHVWVTDRRGDGWGSPHRLGPTVNSPERQLFPTLADDGTIVFGSNRSGGHGGCDIYSASPDGSDFKTAVNLGPAVNSAGDETDALIAPDGSFLVFTAVGREDGYGSGDLYVSFKNPAGSWSPAMNMGETINTPSSEFCPTLSPDGRYFLFTSRRAGSDDIYWVDASVIDSLRDD